MNIFKSTINRRDMLKGLATVPVLGAFFYGTYKKKQYEKFIKSNISEGVKLNYEAPKTTDFKIKSSEKIIRLGIIGFGGRGEDVIKSAGFVHPDKINEIKEAASKNSADTRFEDLMQQEDLNIEITAICDLFDVRAERALLVSGNRERNWDKSKITPKAKRYKYYQELLQSKEVDAVLIATPDHWHAPIAIDAAKAGIHVYVEKCMTKTVEETYALEKAVKDSGIVFQLGHQNRQNETVMKAREAIEKDVLGPVTLVQVNTNRNDPNGAWVYNIHPEANEKNIDWIQFTGNNTPRPFSLERFFRWRCWWDYGTGLSGDLFTHEFDNVNQVLHMGIPYSVMSSGGIYYFKDGREVPDVYQVSCEYPDRNLTLLYSGTLASEYHRPTLFMGHDASMEVGNSLTIKADARSTKYKDQIEKKLFDPNVPIYSYKPGMKEVDAISTATEAYFASRGLLYTYRQGKRVNTTHLHIKEWLDCIRNNQQPSCNIDRGFEEAIAAHMGTLSYKENRRVYWDKDKRLITKG